MTGVTPFAPLLEGSHLRDAFASASQHLREVASAIDAINVYPVPDGDTGANMSATLREAIDAALLLGERPSVRAVLAAIAHGALFGARGNSGVILSQALRGFAEGAGDPDRFDAAALTGGLLEAAAEAYGAVGKPEEGTMLTVLRIAGEAAKRSASPLPGGGKDLPCRRVLEDALSAAEAAEAATIDQLPALREAGVPDAGGEGVCVILRGLLAAISGTVAPAPVLPERPIATFAGHATERFGYCTEFLVEQREGPVDIEAVRALAASGGNRSVVVVGDGHLVHVHVHTSAPHDLIEHAAALGRVARAKVEDMGAQHMRFAATGSGAGARITVLALSRGEGFDAIFRSLGASVTDLGLVTKPPAGEIAAAADALGVPDVIVLPNHKNVVLAARQAAKLARCSLHVVASASLPQGVAATLAFDADENAATNAAAMEAALGSVRTVEVTWAAADRTANGVSVRKGEAIALTNGRLVGSAGTVVDALLSGLAGAGAAEASLVTLYVGSELGPAGTESVRSAVAQEFPSAEVEAVYSGQPLYPLIASVED